MPGGFEGEILALYAAGDRDFRNRTGGHEPNFTGAVLREANLSGLRLERASFRGADLHRSSLRGASLWSAHLSAANLAEADLAGIVANDADFSGADLHNANLSGASLINARFGGADLRGADLRGATVAAPARRRSQKWFCNNCQEFAEVHQDEPGERVSFRGARYNAATKWPRNVDPTEEGAILDVLSVDS